MSQDKYSKRYFNLGIITLKENSTLNSVVVTAPQLIKATNDGYIYDVSADPTAKEKKIVHLLEKLPFIELDHNNKPTYFGGSQKIAYLLNGKSSILLNNSNLVLKLITGTNIKSIELVPNPPLAYSSYDAVINIVTKRSLFEGLLLGLDDETSIVQGIQIKPQVNLAMNFNKFSLVFAGQYYNSAPIGNIERKNIRDSILANGEIDISKRFESLNSSKSNSNGSSFNVASSYQFTDKKTISISFGISDSKSSTKAIGNYQYSEHSENNFSTLSDKIGTDRGYTGSITYNNGRFREKAFNLNYRFNIQKSNDINNIENIYRNNTINKKTIQEGNNNTNTITSTFNLPLKKGSSLTFNFEYEEIFYKNQNTSETYNEIENIATEIPENTVISTNTQQTAELQSGYSFKIKKNTFTFDGKIRYYNNVGSDILASNPIKYEAFSFVPTFNYSIIPSLGSNLSIRISRGVKSPMLFQLNPQINNTDPQNIITGNQNLKPEKIFQFNALYMKQALKFTTSLTLSYSQISDAIERVSKIGTDGVTVKSFGNISGKNIFSAKITERYNFNRLLNFSSHLVFTKTFYNNSNYKDLNNINANITGKYRLSRRSSVSLSLGISPVESSASSIQSRKVYYNISNTATFSGNSRNMKFSYFVIIMNLNKLNMKEKTLVEYNNYRIYSENDVPGFMCLTKISYSFGKLKKPVIDIDE